jgi:hypothetical protein
MKRHGRCAAWDCKSVDAMRTVLYVVVLIWSVLSAQAAPSSHVAKFKEFQEAFAKGDIAAADAAGAEALQLAEANIASPATVQILAANLAGLRLSSGRDGADAPLARAIALHDAGQTAVTPSAIALLQAWAELDATNSATRKRLREAIEAGGDVEAGWRWKASVALATAASTARDWSNLRQAGDLALAAEDGAEFGPVIARGRALTMRGAGKFMHAHGDLDEIRAAQKDLEEAARLLNPIARERLDGTVNWVVKFYGEAAAWGAAARSVLISRGDRIPAKQTKEPAPSEKNSPVTAENLCDYEPINLAVRYPAKAANEGVVGALLALALISPDNRIIDFKVVAEVPRAQFADAARAATLGYVVKPKASNPADCRQSYWVSAYYNFSLR